ncbi:hypothetical protein Tco_0357759 [Tanacetum coccineum]
MGLWYPKDSGFELIDFLDADHAGCVDTRKSTSGGIQFLEAEYVALSASCAQVMWMWVTHAMSSVEAEYVEAEYVGHSCNVIRRG